MFFIRKLEGEEREKAIEDHGKSWRRWARDDLARYWYILLCMFVDLLFNLQFIQYYFRYGGELNLIFTLLSALALVPMLYIEYLIYKKLFPERF